jgi:hypothetical protein
MKIYLRTCTNLIHAKSLSLNDGLGVAQVFQNCSLGIALLNSGCHLEEFWNEGDVPNSEPTVGVCSSSRLTVSTFDNDLVFDKSVSVTFASTLVSDLSRKVVLSVSVPPSA